MDSLIAGVFVVRNITNITLVDLLRNVSLYLSAFAPQYARPSPPRISATHQIASYLSKEKKEPDLTEA